VAGGNKPQPRQIRQPTA